jgi:hypothetical protein
MKVYCSIFYQYSNTFWQKTRKSTGKKQTRVERERRRVDALHCLQFVLIFRLLLTSHFDLANIGIKVSLWNTKLYNFESCFQCHQVCLYLMSKSNVMIILLRLSHSWTTYTNLNLSSKRISSRWLANTFADEAPWSTTLKVI